MAAVSAAFVSSQQRLLSVSCGASPQRRLLPGRPAETARRRGGAPVIGARVPSSGEPAASSRRSDGWRLDLSTTAGHGNNPSANRPPVYTLRRFRAALFDPRHDGRTGLFVCVCVGGEEGCIIGRADDADGKSVLRVISAAMRHADRDDDRAD